LILGTLGSERVEGGVRPPASFSRVLTVVSLHFRCLVAIVEHLIPKDYYSKTLVASQADQRVLRDLLADKLPRLYAHFEALKYGIHILFLFY